MWTLYFGANTLVYFLAQTLEDVIIYVIGGCNYILKEVIIFVIRGCNNILEHTH